MQVERRQGVGKAQIVVRKLTQMTATSDQEGVFMPNLVQRIGLCAIFFVVVACRPSAQTDIAPKVKLCREYAARTARYAADFAKFTYALDKRAAMEHTSAEKLSEISSEADGYGKSASETSNYLSAAADLLSVYQVITRKADQLAAKPIIKSSIEQYIQSISSDIEIVNNELPNTTNPAIAASATALKQDLREIKTLLESIDLQ